MTLIVLFLTFVLGLVLKCVGRLVADPRQGQSPDFLRRGGATGWLRWADQPVPHEWLPWASWASRFWPRLYWCGR